MNTLFNTPDNQEFLGVRSDASLNKANKKGTPQYEEWLRKYREKRGTNSEEVAKESPAAKDLLESGKNQRSKKELDKDRLRVGQYLSFAKQGNWHAIRRRFDQMTDDNKIQSRYDLLKENLSENQIKELDNACKYVVPSLREEIRKKKEQEENAKKELTKRLEPLSEKWNKKFISHFRKITDREKAQQRLNILKYQIGENNPALNGLDSFIKDNATKEVNRGLRSDWRLENKNRERVKELTKEYTKDLKDLGLSKEDFDIFTKSGNDFTTALSRLIN